MTDRLRKAAEAALRYMDAMLPATERAYAGWFDDDRCREELRVALAEPPVDVAAWLREYADSQEFGDRKQALLRAAEVYETEHPRANHSLKERT